MLAVTDDASPRGQVSLALWEPPLTSYAGENGAPVRRAASSETADLLADLVAEDVRTLAFVRSRRGAEQVAMTAAELLAEVDPSLPGRVAAYRGGYLPEERRAIEAALRSGELVGLAATNALELGIDISGLDAVLLAGFPGTRAALWQQVGRAGRGAQDALAVLVARDDPLDTYLVHHPEALFGQPVEATVFDPDNPYVLGPHLCAAAHESPLTEADLPMFGPTAPRRCVDELTEAGLLRRRPRGLVLDRPPARQPTWPTSGRPAGAPVQLVEAEHRPGDRHRRRRPAPTAPPTPARSTCTGARPGWSESLDLEEHVAVIEPADPDYSTSAREITDITIVAEREHRRLGRVPALARRGRRHPPGGVVPQAPPARRARCSARSRSTCRERTLRTTRGVVDRARRRAGRGRARGPPTCRARPTPPSTARSACCRCSRPATAGTSAASRPPCTPTPAG